MKTGSKVIVIQASRDSIGSISATVREVGEAGDLCGIHNDPLGAVKAHAYVGSARDDREVWGWEVSAIDLHLPSTRDVIALGKAMQAIERKMSKMAEVEGRPTTFGAFINRFARAIGAKGVCIAKPRGGVGGMHRVCEAEWCVNIAYREAWPEPAAAV